MPEYVTLSDRYRLKICREKEYCILEEYRGGYSCPSGAYCGKSWHEEKRFTFAEITALQQIQL